MILDKAVRGDILWAGAADNSGEITWHGPLKDDARSTTFTNGLVALSTTLSP